MHWVEIAGITYVKQVQAYYNHEIDVWKFAHKLGLTIMTGDDDALTGKVITLTPYTRSNRQRATNVIRHEIAHYLLRKGGIEKQIFKLQSSYEEGLPPLEKVCYHATLVLLIPDPILHAVLKGEPHLPTALLHLCELTGASMGEAFRRWVYAEVGAKRAAFIVKGNLVVDIAKANCWVPFWRYDEVDELPEVIPEAQLLTLPPAHGRGRLLGVVGWP